MLASTTVVRSVFRGASCTNITRALLTSNKKYANKFSTVASHTIYINFVDMQGNKARVPGLIGDTLLQVAEKNKVELEGACNGGGAPEEVVKTDEWTEYTFGEGPTCFWCHVKIPSTYNNILPPLPEYQKITFQEVWEDEYNATSRLACQITLGKQHDNMVVLIPDMPPTDNI